MVWAWVGLDMVGVRCREWVSRIWKDTICLEKMGILLDRWKFNARGECGGDGGGEGWDVMLLFDRELPTLAEVRPQAASRCEER